MSMAESKMPASLTSLIERIEAAAHAAERPDDENERDQAEPERAPFS